MEAPSIGHLEEWWGDEPVYSFFTVLSQDDLRILQKKYQQHSILNLHLAFVKFNT